MKFPQCACLAVFALVLLVGAMPAQAKDPDPVAAVLPTGNMTMIVPLAAGGPTDALARLVAHKLSERLGRVIVIENKGGAGGNIGAAAVAKAAPNGMTALFTIDSVLTINPFLYASQGFDPQKDLAPVSIVGSFALTLAINAKIPAQSWAELVAYSKTRSLNFGSAGFGSPPHLAFEYLKWVSKFNATHVPYRGAGPVMTELLAGNIDASFLVSAAVIDHVHAGSLRALAVSSPTRLANLPSVPTAREVGIPNFEARFGNLVLVPARTPPAVKQLLSKEIAEVLKDPDVRSRFAALATEPVGGTVAEAETWVTTERSRWGKVIKETGIKMPQ